MNHLETNEYQKMWNRCVTYYYCHMLPGDKLSHCRLKLTFFIDSQCLMALSPTVAHESILKIVLMDLTNILDTIPIHMTTVSCDISASAAH